MERRTPCCAITGANGYVGSRLSDFFASRGWSVLELTRRPSSPAERKTHAPYELGSPISADVFRDNRVSVLIHCAYDFRPIEWEDIRRINVEGTSQLFRAASEAKVDRIIFISSISAFEGCSSLYGKAKMEGEKIAHDLGAFVIRSGLVYGNQSTGGMFGSLQRSVVKSSIVPLIGSGKYLQYLVHEDDLCETIFRFSTEELAAPGKPIVAAFPNGLCMRDLLQVMAASNHREVKFLPLPWPAIWLGLKIPEMLGVRVPFRSDSVISLVHQNPTPDFSTADRMGCRFREFKPTSAPAPA